MKKISLLLVAGVVVGLAACLDDSSSSREMGVVADSSMADSAGKDGIATDSDDALSPAVHECTSYTPTSKEETLTGKYQDASDKPSQSITMPIDPGGGYVTIEVTTKGSGLVPGLQAKAAGDTSGAIIASTANATPDPQSFTAGFSVAPGATYNLTLTQGFNAPLAQYPVDYEFKWTFTSLVDCYEPNDSPAEAKQVPVGTTIDGYAHSGFRSNLLYDTEYVDWYKVVVNRPATIEAELKLAPGEHRTRIRFRENDGTTAMQSGGGSTGGELYTVTQPITQAGAYYLTFEVANAESAKTVNGSDPPLFWSQPYRIALREVK